MRRESVYSVALAVVLASASSCSPAAAGGGDIDPKTAAVRIAADGPAVYVLDVRTPAEVAAGVIPGFDAAADWNSWQSSFAALSPPPARDQEIIVYCRSGRRSAQAAEWLRKQGYSRVFNLTGGVQRWVSEVGPTVAAR